MTVPTIVSVSFDRIGQFYDVPPVKIQPATVAELAARITEYASAFLPGAEVHADLDLKHGHGWLYVTQPGSARTVGSFVVTVLQGEPLRDENAADVAEALDVAIEEALFQEEHGNPKTWPDAVRQWHDHQIADVHRYYHPELAGGAA